MSEQPSYGRQITLRAQEHPDRIALIHAAADGSEREVTWRELEARCNQTARLLKKKGIGQGSVVVVALVNSPEHYYCTIGAWKLGATVLPMRWDLPAWERDRLLNLAKANVVVANWDIKPGEEPAAPLVTLAEVQAGTNLDSGVLPDRVPNPANGITSSGSTGSPKLIAEPRRAHRRALA